VAKQPTVPLRIARIFLVVDDQPNLKKTSAGEGRNDCGDTYR
jgi:hypothetical protein